jgi:hypothetical protein
MTLRERLEAAKADRRRAAGLPVDDPAPEAPKPWVPLEPALDLTGTLPVVDLTTGMPVDKDAIGRSLTEALAVSESDRCPACNSVGRLDLQDIAGGVDHYTCPNCTLLYQTVR